jgi:hypothetical protein
MHEAQRVRSQTAATVGRRSGGSWIPRTDNPVLIRELPRPWRRPRAGFLRSPWIWLAGTILLIAGVLIVPGGEALTPEEWAERFWFITTCLLALLPITAAALGASAFTRERHQRTLEPLLLTRLTPVEICWGKLLARLVGVGWLFLAAAPAMLLMGPRGQVGLSSLAVYLGLALVCAFTPGVVGMVCSAALRRTQTAMVLAVALATLFSTVQVGLVYELVRASIIAAILGSGISRPAFWELSWYYLVVQPGWAVFALVTWGTEPPPVWLHALCWNGGFGLALFAWLCRNLRRLCLR